MADVRNLFNKLRRGNSNVPKDANPIATDATQRTLTFRTQIDEQELWTIIFPFSILISVGSVPRLIQMFFSLGLGGWILEGVESFLGSIIFIYLLVHPFLVIVCSAISWYLHKKNKHSKAIVWAIVPTAGFIIAVGLYYIITAHHPGWG